MISLATYSEELKPYKQSKFSAGYTLKAAEEMVIHPDETRIMPTGVYLTITPPDYVYHGLIMPRQRMINLGLLVHPLIVEADYEGEIKVSITSTDDEENYTIQRGDSIAFLIFQKTVDIIGEIEIRTLKS